MTPFVSEGWRVVADRIDTTETPNAGKLLPSRRGSASPRG
jgi:hypothetical protein